MTKDWRLNERHYGGLTGLNKQEMIDKVGAEQVKIWRRSFDIPPPPLARRQPLQRRPATAATPGSRCPTRESLKDTIARVLPYYEAEIAPALQRGRAGASSRPTAIRCARSKSICRTSATPRSSGSKSRPASRSSMSWATILAVRDRYYLERAAKPQRLLRRSAATLPLSPGTSPGRRGP